MNVRQPNASTSEAPAIPPLVFGLGRREAAEPLQAELSNQRQSIDGLDAHLEEVGKELSERLTALRTELAPINKELSDVRDVVEPLQGATERVGRLSNRLPGDGK